MKKFIGLGIFIITIIFLVVLSGYIRSHTVSFDTKGGNIIEDVKVSGGSTIDLPIPEKNNHIFIKWKLNGRTFDSNKVVIRNIKLEAVWEDATKFFNYRINGENVNIHGYRNYMNIKDLVIPRQIEGRNVSSIHYGAFRNSNIRSIKVPNSVHNISLGAFIEVDNLKSISFYGEYTGLLGYILSSEKFNETINKYADVCIDSRGREFPNSDNKWIFPEECPIKKIVDIRSGYYHVVIDLEEYTDSIQDIGVVFGPSLKKIELPSRLKSCIGCFEMATGLEKITVKEDNPYLTSKDGVLYRKDMTGLLYYPQGKKDKNFTIPSSVTKIPIIALDGNKYLTSINILKDSQLKITDNLFDQFNALENINVEEGNDFNSSIDGVLFNKDKTKLIAYPASKGETYVIPDGITEIGVAVFMSNKLKSVEIPSTVTLIASHAFIDANALEKLIINKNDEVISIDGTESIYINESSNIEIYVPYDLVDDYKESSGWQNIAKKIKPIFVRP